MSIPVFSGEKHAYENWKAAFNACIDQAPATPVYKLLQLRQYLSGDALKCIESLGHSAAAYEAAKQRLDRKFGGQRRQIALRLSELESFRQMHPGNQKDMERFADLLDVAVINLKEAGRTEELGNGSLYTKLQQKMPQTMLACYVPLCPPFRYVRMRTQRNAWYVPLCPPFRYVRDGFSSFRCVRVPT